MRLHPILFLALLHACAVKASAPARVFRHLRYRQGPSLFSGKVRTGTEVAPRLLVPGLVTSFLDGEALP